VQVKIATDAPRSRRASRDIDQPATRWAGQTAREEADDVAARIANPLGRTMIAWPPYG
jgi:hypothetical protein